MKTTFALTIMALVLAFSAAGIKSFLTNGPASTADNTSRPSENAAGLESNSSTSDRSVTKRESATPPDAIDPVVDYDTDVLADVGKQVRELRQDLKRRESELAAREHSLQLILEDIRQQQQTFDTKRADFAEEVKQTIQALESARSALEEQRAHEQQQNAVVESKLAPIVVTAAERTMLRKLGSVFDNMAADSAAGIFQQLANEESTEAGSFDTIVKILGEMKERKAQDILAKLQDGYERDDEQIEGDPELAANLTRRYLALKRSTTAPTTP